MQLLDVRGRFLVDDHQIDGELLHAPIFVRAEELSNDVEIVRIVDAHQNDRQIARNSLPPERRHFERVLLSTSELGRNVASEYNTAFANR